METFSTLLAICAGNPPAPVKSPHKGQWRGALMFSLICVWINGWVNRREAGDLRRYRAHSDVIVMFNLKTNFPVIWILRYEDETAVRPIALELRWYSWVAISRVRNNNSIRSWLYSWMYKGVSMMISSIGDIFSVTGPLWGESTSHQWIPLTKASDGELNGWTNNGDASYLRRHRAHYDVSVMNFTKL